MSKHGTFLTATSEHHLMTRTFSTFNAEEVTPKGSPFTPPIHSIQFNESVLQEFVALRLLLDDHLTSLRSTPLREEDRERGMTPKEAQHRPDILKKEEFIFISTRNNQKEGTEWNTQR